MERHAKARQYNKRFRKPDTELASRFIREGNRFLAGWCGVAEGRFRYHIDRVRLSRTSSAKYPHPDEVKITGMTYWNTDSPAERISLTMPGELKFFLALLEQVDKFR